MEQFDTYFQRADVDRDGRISGNEAVTFLQASNLPRQVLAQIWMYADQNRSGFLGRQEFYNALKLVTVAQSKKDLTPELVKAALYGPASAKIPAPQINLSALPGPQTSAMTGPPPVQQVGPRTPNPGTGIGALQGHLVQQNQAPRPPRPPSPTSGFHPQLNVSTQGMPGAGVQPVSQRPSLLNSVGGTKDGPGAGISPQTSNSGQSISITQAGLGPLVPTMSQPKVHQDIDPLHSASSKPIDTAHLSSQLRNEDTKSPSATGNGFGSDSVFGDVFSATTQPNQNSMALTNPAKSTPASAGNLTSSIDQTAVKTSAVPHTSTIQDQHTHLSAKANLHSTQKSPEFPVAAGKSLVPWPKMTQLDVQKYSKVFVQVDTDRDGKITGEQARNLFLSWRLPREILKQVWDLSDQDNDSMLSLREFCIALYLMERFREGHRLPTTFPASVLGDETLLRAPGQPVAAYGNTSWRPPSLGVQQPQGTRNIRPVTSAGVGKPPRHGPVPQPDEPVQQKAKVPILEKHLVDQLSTEEQDSLNKRLEEAKDAEKRVADLEKDIVEARQKLQFYHGKMQELVLYKSRCDSRLNEISEKVVGDKREAELLAKKYEEKYKQGGDVASKLTLEESTFRDIQEKKMEIYRSIIKLEHENADVVKDQASKTQSDLDELVKALNERCKTYGLRGKPTSLVELPFGWQPGIGASAADWDENWDKLDDEGFTFVKELTLEVENVIAPPKPKSTLIREKVAPLDTNVKSPSKTDDKSELQRDGEEATRTMPDSPAGSYAAVSPSKEFQDLRKTKDFNADGSPHAFDTHSEFGAESVLGDKGYDEFGSFDTHYDSGVAWDINLGNSLEAELERQSGGSLFGGDNWGLNPIKTGSRGTDTSILNQGPFFDSVPSTPLTYQGTEMSLLKQGPFFDSVPSTPVSFSASSPRADYFSTKKSSPFAFADSIPSTPMYSSANSPRRFGEGSDRFFDNDPQGSRDSFNRFDSFSMNDRGPFGSKETTFTRFDSMRSTRDRDSMDFDYNFGAKESSLARFDSFRSAADSDYNFGSNHPQETFSRFDSRRSSTDFDYGRSFPSFDDVADPFGSSEPFKSSNEQFKWSDDAADPFGSSEPFKVSHDTQSPRKDDAADLFESTARRDSDSWKAF